MRKRNQTTRRWTQRDVIMDEIELVLADPLISLGHAFALHFLRHEMLRRMRERHVRD